MKIWKLNDGSVEIQTNEISYTSLIRCIRRIPETKITDITYDPMNDHTCIIFEYKDIRLTIETPFSDYIIDCDTPGSTFDEFVAILTRYRVKWWERFLGFSVCLWHYSSFLG